MTKTTCSVDAAGRPIQPYYVQKRNATAVNILRAWLNAVGVPTAPAQEEGYDLLVGALDGGEVAVQVALHPDESGLGGAVKVLAGDLTGKKVERALAAFHQVTDAAGYDRAQPFDRGVDPELNEKGNPRKLHYRDEDFLVAIRHNEFRRAPNPPEDRWKQYRPTIEKTSWAFLRNNFELCARNGFDIGDLLTYARAWTVNFCGRYEAAEARYFDNERKLHVHLQQRFLYDLRPILEKKERNVLPDAETVSLALYGRPDCTVTAPGSGYGERLPEDVGEVEEVDYAYVERHCELDTSTPAARRASAAAKLEELLGQLPHDRLVEVLADTAKSVFFDSVTRKEAARRLRLHTEGCASCHVGIEEHEDLAAGDPLSVEE